jgi:manganese/iron transport system permease protein
MAEPHAALAAPAPSSDLDFDSLLAPSPSTPAALGSAPVPRTTSPALGVPLSRPAHEEHPTWHDFASSWDLYRDPVVCGVVAGAVLGMLGVFVVLRRAVFVTAAVSQSAALGVALAFLLGIYLGFTPPPVLCAFLLAASATGALALRSPAKRLPREAVVGLLYVGASALAVLVGDRIAQEAEDITAILFGTAVLVRPQDLLLVLTVSALVAVAMGALYRGLVFAGFDPDGARIQGLPVARIELLLWMLVALEVSVTTRAIGALPVFAFSVLPAMAALRASNRLSHAVLLAGLCGALSGGLGYLSAFMLRFPVGAAEACVAALLFSLAAGLARLRRTT